MPNFSYENIMAPFKTPVYQNALASAADVVGFRLEGTAKVDFPDGRMRLSSVLDPALGQAANYVYWCDRELPSDVLIEWDFTPLSQTGLCMMFFSAKNCNGGSVFDAAPRSGKYNQYNNSDINTFHVSYYRLLSIHNAGEKLRTCNLRKSKGFHMAAQGGDPIPELKYCKPPFRLSIFKNGPLIAFYVDRIPSFVFYDDGETYGPLLTGGHMGFRQMSPTIGEYANLTVRTL
ncbi:MAG: YesU family protein [Treponema sp.]|nr:YesU family protein [Treponema sp.]